MLMNCVNSGWVLLSGRHRTRTRMAIRGRVRLAPERVVGWLGCLVDANGWRLEEPKENAGVFMPKHFQSFCYCGDVFSLILVTWDRCLDLVIICSVLLFVVSYHPSASGVVVS
jgi:hypothetical protein